MRPSWATKRLGRAEGKNNGGRKPGKVAAASTAAAALQLGWNGSPDAAAYIDAEVAALKEQKFVEAVQAAEANAEEVPVPQSAETVVIETSVQEAHAETAAADVTDVVAKPSKNKGKKAN